MMPKGTLFELIVHNPLATRWTTNYQLAPTPDQARARFLEGVDHTIGYEVAKVVPAQCNHESPSCEGPVTLWTHGIITLPWCEYHGQRRDKQE